MSKLGPTFQERNNTTRAAIAQTLAHVRQRMVRLCHDYSWPKRWVYWGWFGGVQIHQKGGRT